MKIKNMKKILLSLLIIAGIGGAIIVGTRAFFSDTETSPDNTLAAGTIDISVDGHNPWTSKYTQDWTDFKPGVVKYIEFTVKNEGENPVVLRKKLGDFVLSTGIQSEPECEAENGNWSGSACTDPTLEDNAIQKVIVYDMTVTPQGGSPIVLIPEAWGKTLADVQDLWVPLGTVLPGQTLVVKQSYKMDEDAGNQYQGDTLKFDIDLYAEQRLGVGINTTNGVVLDNKTGPDDWYSVVDGAIGFFHYDSATHNYTFDGYGLEPGIIYRLTYRTGSNNPSDMNSGMAAADGKVTLSGNHVFGITNGVFVDLMYGANLWGSDLKNLWQDNQVDFL